MNKRKLGKAKNSINNLDANKSNSGVLNTEMSVMYNLSNMTTAASDVPSKENELKKWKTGYLKIIKKYF